ncbi:MAG: RNA polymerase sigma-70 factor [Actinomycetia bacterium]|nr:RNA polymerase sigma-70 factor [Actinomycetes bacterium]
MESEDDAVYRQFRPLLFSLAYRMTGSVAEAEDIVSETFLHYERAHARGVEVRSHRAYLTTTTTRLSIDHLRSARHNREVYVGPWMPEPLLSRPEDDVEGQVERYESLSLAFMVLLESLSPVERAVFLLREVFQYDYAEVAAVVGKSEVNCRQILRRARNHLASRAPRFEVSREQRDRVAGMFFAAVDGGDLDALVDLLTEDAVLYGDGGGVGPSMPRPIHGRTRVVRLMGVVSDLIRRFGLRVQPAVVNGQPGAAVRDAEGRLLNVLALDIVDGRVQTVRSIINPDKLHHLGPLLDARLLMPARATEAGDPAGGTGPGDAPDDAGDPPPAPR